MKFITIFLLTFFTAFAYEENCDDILFSFDISKKNSKVKMIDIVENMADTCKFSVRIKDKQANQVLKKQLFLVHIKDYTLENMFDFLFTQHNMFFKFDNVKNVLTISYLETHSFTIDYVNFSELTTDSTKTISVGVSTTDNENNTDTNTNNSSSSNSDLTTITSKSQFLFWNKLSHEIDAILSRDEDDVKIKSKSVINQEAGIITVTGTRDQIQKVSDYLSKIKHRLHKQVMLETKLIELTYKNNKDRGIDWTKLQLSFSGSKNARWANSGNSSSYIFSADLSMDGLFKFLDGYGNTDVMSAPKILTLNNQPAVINVGNQINYRYQSGSQTSTTTGATTTNTYVLDSVFVGLTLNIVPEITDDGYVILRINPVVSEEVPSVNNVVDANNVRIMPPDIKIKQLSSIVKARNGSKVIIGGLVSKTINKTNNSVPILGSIPLLGYAFKHEGEETVKTELIVVITPKIVNDYNFPSIEKVTENDSVENKLSIEDINETDDIVEEVSIDE